MLIKKPQLCRLVPNRTSGGSGLSRSPIAEPQQGLLVTSLVFALRGSNHSVEFDSNIPGRRRDGPTQQPSLF